MSTRVSSALALALIISGLADAQSSESAHFDTFCPKPGSSIGDLTVTSYDHELLCGQINPVYPVQRANSGNRIFWGSKASPGEFPYQAQILKEGSHHCGGVIIDKWHILTAAHCIHICNTMENNEYVYHMPKENLRVIVGEYSLSTEDGEVCLEIDEIMIPKEYSSHCLEIGNYDIALIRTKSPIEYKFTEEGYGSINRVCMPTTDVDQYYGSALTSGWGYSEQNPREPDVLRSVKLPIAEFDECKQNFTHLEFEKVVCAGERREDGTYLGTSRGDSGGPLVQLVGDQYHLIGVLSGGCRNKEEQPIGPKVFTKVSYHLDWINEQRNKWRIDGEL